jgi:poly-beta-1,6-N-acetyl-D-glucosamine N-deacetylase
MGQHERAFTGLESQTGQGIAGLGLVCFFLLLLTMTPLPALSAPPVASGAAGTVVLAYFRFGKDEYPDTSIGAEQFVEHLTLLAQPGVRVVSLPTVLDGPAEGLRPGEVAVAVTVDNAYLSFYQEAWPLLKEAGIPFTLFIATDLIDGGAGRYMNWEQVKELADAGVTIGLRGAAHAHLPALSDLELLKDIRHAQSRLETELGITARLFSYPYGEYSNRVINVLESHGFLAAFGQHSGVVSATTPIFALPRFPMTERFADVDRFELAIHALPLEVTDITPRDNALLNPQPQIGFTVDEAMGPLDRLNCFATDQGMMGQTVIGRRVELRLPGPLTPGRGRINCTMPVNDSAAPETENSDAASRWRWLGMNFYVPEEIDPTGNEVGGNLSND